MNNTKIVIGILAGTAIGASLGLLMASDKGKDARKKIIKEGKKYAGTVNESFDHVVNKMSNKLAEMNKETDQIINKLKVNAKQLTNSN